ncbi:hypothetical protein [Streptomyces sp. NPDC001980]|uniref:hypothetical protein n=1 Tax=Streptomyces sp. NPDC001980 TaxID=3157126 RepID=UPI003318AE01
MAAGSTGKTRALWAAVFAVRASLRAGRGQQAVSDAGEASRGVEGRPHLHLPPLPAGEGRAAVRVHAGEDRDTAIDVYQGRRNYVRNSDDSTATLRDEVGRFVVDASWSHHHGEHRDGGGCDERGDRDGGRRDARR